MHQQFQAIQSDYNKSSGEESTLSLMPPQTLGKKVQLKKKMPKIQNYNPDLILSEPARGIIMEN